MNCKIKTQKQAVRADVRDRIRGYTDEERNAQSLRVCQLLLNLPQLQAAQRIGIYLALPDELQLQTAITVWLDGGKELAAPVFRSSEWRFEQLSDLRNTGPGAYGIQEPNGMPVSTDRLDAVIVPGRAFTSNGIRVGRGKGIYDRLLEGFRGQCVGVGFACQRWSQLPEEAHDRKMDQALFG